MNKTILNQLIEQLEQTIPEVKNGNAIDKNYWLDLEKEELCKFWMEGNKQGWAQQTDWPHDAEKFYKHEYHSTVKWVLKV